MTPNSNPAIVSPIMRDRLNCTDLSATAQGEKTLACLTNPVVGAVHAQKYRGVEEFLMRFEGH
jgi:hypothetical protein